MLVVSICSAKGGVGKSFITTLLAKNLQSIGLNVGILDADIYGPCQHSNLDFKLQSTDFIDNFFVPKVIDNIKLLSASMMVDETDINLIRGPLISSILQELSKKSQWGDTDILLIDMPPGTGDSYISLFQSNWIDSAIIVTSSSKISLNQSIKTFYLCKNFNVPIAGFIENFFGFSFPDSCNVRNYLSETLNQEITFLSSIPTIDTFHFEIPDLHYIHQKLKKYTTKIKTKNIF